MVKVEIKLEDGTRGHAIAKVMGTSEYGLPITTDQDKFFAFTKLLETYRQKYGHIPNFVPLPPQELARLTGRKSSGGMYEEVDEWLSRMVATTIESEGVIWLAGRKKFAKDTFHLFERVVRRGEELPDGTLATQVHVKLSDWLLENFHSNYVLPIDYEMYREMKFPIAKALTPLIQIWFYAARFNYNLIVEKRYGELSDLLSLRKVKHRSKIEETLQPSLDELIKHKLIGSWKIERTADDQDFKLVITPGARFLSERQVKRISDKPGVEDDKFRALLDALCKRGVHEDAARQILFNARDFSVVEAQIAYGDYECSRRRKQPIRNPAGLYRFFIEENIPVPEHIRAQIKKTKASKQQDVEVDYENYRIAQAKKKISEIGSEELAFRRDQIQNRLQMDCPNWEDLPKEVTQAAIEGRLWDEIIPQLSLPSFEEFSKRKQMTLGV